MSKTNSSPNPVGFLPISNTETIFTIFEIGVAFLLYQNGSSGAAGFLLGSCLGAFITRRMAFYHVGKYMKGIMDKQS